MVIFGRGSWFPCRWRSLDERTTPVSPSSNNFVVKPIYARSKLERPHNLLELTDLFHKAPWNWQRLITWQWYGSWSSEKRSATLFCSVVMNSELWNFEKSELECEEYHFSQSEQGICSYIYIYIYIHTVKQSCEMAKVFLLDQLPSLRGMYSHSWKGNQSRKMM